MEKIKRIIGIIHILGIIIVGIYGLLPCKNKLIDKMYMINFAIIPLSWIIFKDECLVSYLTKKLKNKNYKLGEDPNDVSDISDFFNNENEYKIFNNVKNILRIYSIIIINNRTTKIDNKIIIPALILYLIYTYDISCNLNYRKKLYPYFQIILSYYLLVIICKTINK
jgi:hypothetical protein